MQNGVSTVIREKVRDQKGEQIRVGIRLVEHEK